MKQEYFWSDLEELVVEKDRLCAENHAEKWRVIPYETAGFSGKMLAACQLSHPQELTLNLKVKGWYNVYLGLCGIPGSVSTGIRINGEDGRDVVDFVQEMAVPEPHWAVYTFLREQFYRPVQFSGDGTLTLFKPQGGTEKTSMLAYIRLVRMTEEEVSAYLCPGEGRVYPHFDQDFLDDCDYRSLSEYASRLRMLKGFGSGILFLETSFDEALQPEEGREGLPSLVSHSAIPARMRAYQSRGREIRDFLCRTAGEMGMKVYGTHRMEVGDFFFPYELDCHNDGWQQRDPQYRCKTRDGRTVKVLSYAYPEVRKRMVERLVRISQGLDGMSLIFHRGLHVGFEEPVLEEVRKQTGLDGRRLPCSDERLYRVTGSFMTQFLRELRAALPPEKKINVILFYDPVSSLHVGLDAETWARENLIDSITQGIMTVFEDLTGCFGEDGLIDLERFAEQNAVRQTTKRDYYDGDFAKIAAGSEAFLRICSRYHKEYYGSLGWESMSPKRSAELAVAQRAAGVKTLFSWDANHKAKRLPILHAEEYLSRNFETVTPETMPDFVRYIRVLSICDTDISSYDPNWKG